MNPFEKALLNEIPADEAADFFLRVTGRDKLAQAGINAFVGERAELLVKKANAMAMPGPGMSGGALKPPGPVAAPAAPMLSPSAQGQNTVMQGTAGAAKTASRYGRYDEDYDPLRSHLRNLHEEVSNEMERRSVADSLKSKVKGLSAKKKEQVFDRHIDAEAEAGRRGGAITGGVMGAMIGGTLGAMAGASTGNPAALVAGIAGGGVLGGFGGAALGKPLGESSGKARGIEHVDYAKKKKYDDLFTTAWAKAASEKMKAAFDGAGGMPSPGTPDDEPTIDQYMMAEQQGQQAEEQQGAEYFKQRFQQASQQLQETQAQASQTQEQAAQLEQQVAQSDQQVQSAMQQAQMAAQSAQQNIQSAHEMAMQATSQAMESQAEVLKQKQLAAAMRMGVQQLKDNVMGAMANDPTEALAQQLQAPPPGSAGVVGQNPQQPQPAIDPATGQPMPQDPAAAGGAPPEAAQAGGEAPAAPAEKSESKPKEKSEKKDDKKGGGTEVTVKHSAMQFQALAQMFKAAV